VPDAIYTDPRLAAVYDVFNPWDRDTAFYLDLAGAAPRCVLDMGCGTGRLTRDLAARGHRATGADPAEAMLTVARRRPGGDRVTWVATDAAGLSLDARFDLIVMTGHVFQVFLTDDEVRAVPRALYRHLAAGGRLAFETRNPSAREWRDWTPARTSERAHVEGIGSVEVHYDVQSVADALVTFETHYRFPDGDHAAVPSTLRFMTQDEVAAHLGEAGFTDLTWYGDWDRSPVSPTSP
jgi:SAM-dependent methyltransferase